MPSLRFQKSKWSTLLALLAPPRSALQPLLPAATASTSSPIAADFTCEPLPVPSSLHLIAAGANGSIALVDAECVATRNSSSAFTSDMDMLLDVFLHMPSLDDINAQMRTLDTLCTLCSTTPGAADRCAAVGGIKIILDTLNSTAQPRSCQPLPSSIVEGSEKALLLLHLITASSKAGCAAALQQSSCIINTLSKKLLRLSEACTASVVAILCTLCAQPEAALFRKALSETATPSKLVVVLQVASRDSTKHGACRLLRLLQGQQQQSASEPL